MATTDQNKGLALVTGSSRGLGHELASRLAEQGWLVYGFARSASDIASENYNHVPIDLADMVEVESYFEGEFLRILAEQSFSSLVLINNAGQISPVDLVSRLKIADLADAYQLNAIVPTWLMGFCQRHWPRLPLTIVNVSSGAATKPYAGWTAYCSTKAAFRMAGLVMAEEESQAPLRVLAYSPGVLNSKLQEEVRGLSPEVFPQWQRFQKLYEEGKLLDPALPAQEIIEILDQPFQGRQFIEKRYGES